MPISLRNFFADKVSFRFDFLVQTELDIVAQSEIKYLATKELLSLPNMNDPVRWISVGILSLE